jgi:4-amino-4-deoxy-L-arabinose transferase-like glycosyltransferase
MGLQRPSPAPKCYDCFSVTQPLRGFSFVAPVVILLGVMAAVQIAASRDDSATFDEAAYITAGYTYLQTGDFRINLEHPPVSKLLVAFPLVLLHPDDTRDHPARQAADLGRLAHEFLYRNRVPADTLLAAARSANIVLTVLLGLAFALWTRTHFGAPAALFSLFLFATDPNFLAHGRYATNDLPLALFFFLAVIAWTRYLLRRQLPFLLLSAAAFSLALLTKFSAVVLLPLFVLLYALRAWPEKSTPAERPLSLDRFAGSVLLVAAVFVILTWAAYGFKARVRAPGSPPGYSVSSIGDIVGVDNSSGRVLAQIARILHLPGHPYILGFANQASHGTTGHAAYLLGQISQTGWWYYFPVAFAVKTPTAVLLLVLAGIATASRRAREMVRTAAFPSVVAVLSISLYGAVMIAGAAGIGIRYLLPLYPFLFALLGAMTFRVWAPRLERAFPYVLGAILLVQTAESAAIFPHHLAFFNTLSGGPANGSRYLLDSNLDWGQDLKRLKRYFDRSGTRDVCIAYFGTAPAEYYGIQANGLAHTSEVQRTGPPNCLAAISLTMLHDLYLPPGSYSWLRRLRPAARVGYSIWIYDLRR